MLNTSSLRVPVPALPPGTDLDAVEAELATLDAHINAATHRKLELIRLIDISERWAQQGAKTCAHWLSCASDSPRAARESKSAWRVGSVTFLRSMRSFDTRA